MTDHPFNLQTAIKSALVDADVAGGRIYDQVPQDVTFPYVEFGDKHSLPDDLSGDDQGRREHTKLDVWSRYRGRKEVLQIISAIEDALHGTDLTVTGRASALTWVIDFRVIRDPDGLTVHGVIDLLTIHRS